MTLRVALLARAAAEEDAAWAWLQGHREFEAQRFPLTAVHAAAAAADVLWVHASAPADGIDAARLAEAAAAGRGVLLTLRAAMLVQPMGLEPAPPNEDLEACWRAAADEFRTGDLRAMPAYPHVRGLATWGPHPLVTGLHNGTYCWAPTEGERAARCCYAHGARPAAGRVVAVERAYIAQNPGRIVAWEYETGAGRVLCVGAYVHFAAPDRLLRAQLERLVENALAAALPARDEEGATWPQPATLAAPSEALALPDPLELDGALPEPGEDRVALTAEPAGDDQFDLAGRRLLLVGRERAGIRELWVHPHRAVASWDVHADGRAAEAVRVAVTPDVVVRTLEAGERRLTETVFVALEHPVAVVEYHGARRGRESVGRGPALLEVRLTVDLRRMWPFAAGCGGNLRFRRSAHGLVAVVASESDDGIVALFTSRPAELTLRMVHGAAAPLVECVIGAPLGVPLRLAVVGGASPADLERSLRAVRRLGVDGLVRQRRQRAETLRDARVAVRCDEPRFATAFEWAKRRLDLFLGDVPGVGRSLLAGYASSRPGWNEARPGYAWFFGRDACWSAFALLALGEHSLPRQVIRFLGDRQDVSGKVLHEATTSGQFHYDAADSTPLYLLLVARYLQWTGDADFVRSIWPHALRALAFCEATDTDGDGLIENTRVGHGWIEDGPLGGAHVTLYLAALWRAALEGTARVAEALGDTRTAADCWARAARAAGAIASGFWDGRRGLHALDHRPGGGRTWTQTALHAVPLLLGAAAPQQCRRVLDLLGGDDLTAPWGVRLVSRRDPHFRGGADGYHAGAVWPLFTGWAALAEYGAGRCDAAFRHLMMNARLPFARQLGAFDEVLHGLEEEGAGVCPDQAWSAAMLALPVVEGLLGAQPDASNGRFTLGPCLPDAWDRLEARGLRCGETAYDLRVRRRDRTIEIGVRRTSGPALWLTLAPWLATAALRAVVDGQELQPTAAASGEGVRCSVSFLAGGEHEVLFEA